MTAFIAMNFNGSPDTNASFVVDQSSQFVRKAMDIKNCARGQKKQYGGVDMWLQAASTCALIWDLLSQSQYTVLYVAADIQAVVLVSSLCLHQLAVTQK